MVKKKKEMFLKQKEMLCSFGMPGRKDNINLPKKQQQQCFNGTRDGEHVNFNVLCRTIVLMLQAYSNIFVFLFSGTIYYPRVGEIWDRPICGHVIYHRHSEKNEIPVIHHTPISLLVKHKILIRYTALQVPLNKHVST